MGEFVANLKSNAHNEEEKGVVEEAAAAGKEAEEKPSNDSSVCDNAANADADEYMCQICLDDFDVGDTVMFHRNNSNSNSNSKNKDRHFLACGHVFHEECIMQWL